MANWCLPETHKPARVGPARNGPVHLGSTPIPPFYAARIKELEDLECKKELAEVLGLKDVSHEDLSRHHCVDWLKAHEAGGRFGTKAGECHRQDAGECTTPHQAGMGVSRETIGSDREQGHDSRKIRHDGERSHHWGVLEGTREG